MLLNYNFKQHSFFIMSSDQEEEVLPDLPEIPNSVLYKPIINGNMHRRPFSKEEDARLIYLVDYYGDKAWKKIAKLMPRSVRQCKDRYECYLSPTQRKDEFTPEEDALLIEKVDELGPKWEKISTFFNGRCGNKLKNRYNIHLKKRKMGPNQNICRVKKEKETIEKINHFYFEDIETDDDGYFDDSLFCIE